MCIVVAFHRYLGSDFFIYSGFSQIGFKQTWQYSWWHYRDTPKKVEMCLADFHAGPFNFTKTSENIQSDYANAYMYYCLPLSVILDSSLKDSV